jgi:hypothetical protein
LDDDTRHYVDARFDGVHRRIDDQARLTERAQDKAAESMGYRLEAMDHDRDLLREQVGACVTVSRGNVLETRIRSLERTVTLLIGGLMLAVALLGLAGTLIVKYG